MNFILSNILLFSVIILDLTAWVDFGILPLWKNSLLPNSQKNIITTVLTLVRMRIISCIHKGAELFWSMKWSDLDISLTIVLGFFHMLSLRNLTLSQLVSFFKNMVWRGDWCSGLGGIGIVPSDRGGCDSDMWFHDHFITRLVRHSLCLMFRNTGKSGSRICEVIDRKFINYFNLEKSLSIRMLLGRSFILPMRRQSFHMGTNVILFIGRIFLWTSILRTFVFFSLR